MEKSVVEQNLATVRRVCEEWATLTAEEFGELMAPDVDYRNIPIEGDHHVGPDAVHGILRNFSERWNVRLEVENLVGDEHRVLSERTEYFSHRGGTKNPFALPVMGTFELKDGKITAWRDYFDLNQLRLR